MWFVTHHHPKWAHDCNCNCEIEVFYVFIFKFVNGSLIRVSWGLFDLGLLPPKNIACFEGWWFVDGGWGQWAGSDGFLTLQLESEVFKWFDPFCWIAGMLQCLWIVWFFIEIKRDFWHCVTCHFGVLLPDYKCETTKILWWLSPTYKHHKQASL